MCQIYATFNSLSSSADLEAALVCLPAETLITKKSKIDWTPEVCLLWSNPLDTWKWAIETLPGFAHENILFVINQSLPGTVVLWSTWNFWMDIERFWIRTLEICHLKFLRGHFYHNFFYISSKRWIFSLHIGIIFLVSLAWNVAFNMKLWSNLTWTSVVHSSHSQLEVDGC